MCDAKLELLNILLLIKRNFQSTQDYLIKLIWNIRGLLAGTKILARTLRMHSSARSRKNIAHRRPRSVYVKGRKQRSKVFIGLTPHCSILILYTLQTRYYTLIFYL